MQIVRANAARVCTRGITRVCVSPADIYGKQAHGVIVTNAAIIRVRAAVRLSSSRLLADAATREEE